MMQTGSMSPVGRITCSVKTPPVRPISHGPGVAETNTDSGRICSHSSNLSGRLRSEEHTSELQSLMRISYAVFCFKKKHTRQTMNITIYISHYNNNDFISN